LVFVLLALGCFYEAGVTVAGVPVAGVTVAGVTVAGVPVAGVTVAGVPVAGVPVAGVTVAGVPVAGVTVAITHKTPVNISYVAPMLAAHPAGDTAACSLIDLIHVLAAINPGPVAGTAHKTGCFTGWRAESVAGFAPVDFSAAVAVRTCRRDPCSPRSRSASVDAAAALACRAFVSGDELQTVSAYGLADVREQFVHDFDTVAEMVDILP